jgi:hypothetical protein
MKDRAESLDKSFQSTMIDFYSEWAPQFCRLGLYRVEAEKLGELLDDLIIIRATCTGRLILPRFASNFSWSLRLKFVCCERYGSTLSSTCLEVVPVGGRSTDLTESSVISNAKATKLANG